MESNVKATSPSYYEILGVAVNSSAEQIRRAYHKLAMKWHPDRWTKDPYRSGEAKRRFQQIQEAYSVLSDQRRRSLYDMGLYDTAEDEGYYDFVEEMVSLMAQTRREEKQYSLEELQTMVDDMVFIVPFKYVLACVLFDQFTRELEFWKEMVKKFKALLRERWEMVPTAPVLVLPFVNEESAPATQGKQAVQKTNREVIDKNGKSV